MILSIIIPVYNVELYIGKCLQSCLKQNSDFENYEIIVINDGSNDTSFKIIKSIVKDISNVKIINQPNKGLSAARNIGLKQAKGEYIWFVDGDDWIEQNIIIELYKAATTCNLDILALNACNRDLRGNKTLDRSHKYIQGKIYSGEDYFLQNKFQTCVPFYIFRRSFLEKNNLSFYIGIFHEDSEFTPRAILSTTRIGSVSFLCYNVLIREGSITRSINYKKSYDILLVANSLLDFAKNRNLKDNVKTILNWRIAMNLNSALHNSRLNKTILTNIIYKIKNNSEYIHAYKNSSSITHYAESFFFKFPVIFRFIYRLHKINKQ